MPDRKEETTVKTHILMYQRWTDREIENQLFAEYAKSYPDEQKIIELINHGADINAVDNKGESLLINAIGSVNFGLDLKFIWLLIDAGVDISSTVGGGNCLYMVVMSGHPEIVSMLLNVGADPNSICVDHPVSLLDWAETKLLFEELVQGSDLSPFKQIVQLLKSYGARSITELDHTMVEGSPPRNNRMFSVVPNRKYMEV